MSNAVLVCALCADRDNPFAIPADPIDGIGLALMQQHVLDHLTHGETQPRDVTHDGRSRLLDGTN